jgi:hypothetical protein
VATPFIGTKLHQWAVGHGLIADDHYRIISSHEGSIGNEHLSPLKSTGSRTGSRSSPSAT